MIISRLWGGLGNQMFQYAFGFVKAKEVGTKLVLDTRFFSEDFIRQNPRFTKQKLNLFKLPIDFKETINSEGEMNMVNRLQKHRVNQILRIPYYSSIPIGNGFQYVKESRMKYQPILRSLHRDNVYYDGYWQTEKYFDHYRQELLRQYTFSSARANTFAISNYCTESNSVSIHMRMGDYGSKHLTAHYNYVINPDYYKNAIKWIKTKIDNPRFYVCSNNIVKANEFLGDSKEYVYVSAEDGMTDLDEFAVMMQCPHHIISNSTFSWWAAWLGEKEYSINVAPNIVFGNKDIIPDRWIKVEAE